MNDEYAGVDQEIQGILKTLRAARDCGVPAAKLKEIVKHHDLQWYTQQQSVQKELSEILRGDKAPAPLSPAAPQGPRSGP